MSNQIEHTFDNAFEVFKQHLLEHFGVVCSDESRVREIFMNEIVSLVERGLHEDAQSGCCLDEMYGDDILECVQ